MRSLPRALIALCLLLALCVVPSAHATGSPTAASTSARYLPLEWHLSTLHVAPAWAQGITGRSVLTHRKVGVFIIDTGMSRLPVLSGNIGPSYSALAPVTLTTPPAYSPDKPLVYTPSPFDDVVGHGSFVASEIASHGPDYLGICPDCLVGMGRVFDQGDAANDTDIIRAYYYAINARDKQGHPVYSVVSMSLGGGTYDPLFQQVIDYGWAHGMACVAAAGNEGSEGFTYPASYKHCLRITATNQNDLVTDWSSYGGDVALAAPGAGVYGYLPSAHNLIGNEGFSTLSGTSMATPLVAGALALVISAGYSPQDAEAALLATARLPKSIAGIDGQDAEHWGAGYPDVARAVAWAHAQHYQPYRESPSWTRTGPPVGLQQDSATTGLPLPSSGSFKISAAEPM